jgi:1-deoxy-D-xylulose-5-phosphate synthase
VGALSRYFNRVRLNPKLWHAREDVEGGLTKLPALGATFERLGPHVKESIKAFWAPGLWWEELDFAYMGVIDGHDVRALRRALREALAAERPVVVHCATVKGKGFAPAEDGGLEGMEKWHAAKPKSIAHGAPAAQVRKPSNAKPSPPQYTQVFGSALVDECRRDDRVIGITAAMNSGTGLNILQRELPDRYYDVGIAEQQAVLFAAGLALQGCKPVAAIYSTFLQRAYDQLIHDVVLQNLPVMFAIDRAGIVGADGPTHIGAFDLTYLRCLPNTTVMAPADENECRQLLTTAFHLNTPSAVRYPRGSGPGVRIEPALTTLPVGKGEIRRAAKRRSNRIAILAFGQLLYPALAAAEELDCTVANMRFVKPLDGELIRALAREHDAFVTIEENVVAGGAGSGVAEFLAAEKIALPILHLGLPDRFIDHGDPAFLLAHVGLDAKGIAASIHARFAQRTPESWAKPAA